MPRQQPAWWAEIPPLNAQGLTDAEIAERIGKGTNTVYIARRRLGLPTNVPGGGLATVYERHDTRPGCDRVVTVSRPRPRWYGQLAVLHALGMNDGQIARALDRPPETVWKARTVALGLPANTRAGGFGRPVDDE